MYEMQTFESVKCLSFQNHDTLPKDNLKQLGHVYFPLDSIVVNIFAYQRVYLKMFICQKLICCKYMV